MVEEVNEVVTGPVGKLRCARNHYLVFYIVLALSDDTLHHLIGHHHVGDSKAEDTQSPLACIDITLQFEAEGEWLLMEVQAQVRFLSQVTHDGLQGIGSI